MPIAVHNTTIHGKRYWRSLDELAGDPSFFDTLGDEFAPDADRWHDPTSRRNFLRLMGASLALAGVVGCSDFPDEQIVPYVNQPESVVPGKPTYYATTIPLGGFGFGALVESHEGRPTKIEGNPDHPASRGASNIFMQASVLDLYDPDRSKLVTRAAVPSTWGTFYESLRGRLDRHRGRGEGLRIVSRTLTSPTQIAQREEFKRQFPAARWHVHEPMALAGCSARNGGAPGQAIYDFSKADAILSLDADFVFSDVGSLAYARQFIDGRRRQPGVSADQQKMNRLYVVESTLSLTGAMADHRKAVKPSEILGIARAIAAKLGVENALSDSVDPQDGNPVAWASRPCLALNSQFIPLEIASVPIQDMGGTPMPQNCGSDPASSAHPAMSVDVRLQAFINAVADDLRHLISRTGDGAGVSVVVAGDHQPVEVQALAYAMNRALGSIGKAVRYIEPIAAAGDGTLQSLVSDMAGGSVDTLLIFGGNPVYDAPADVPLQRELQRLSTAVDEHGQPKYFTVHLGAHDDETSFSCQWHVPESHYLEAWGDARAFDGTASLIQPIILPLYPASRSQTEFMEAVLGRPDQSGYEAVRALWRSRWAQRYAAQSSQTQPTSRPTSSGGVNHLDTGRTFFTPSSTAFAKGDVVRTIDDSHGFEAWWQDVLRKGWIAADKSDLTSRSTTSSVPGSSLPLVGSVISPPSPIKDMGGTPLPLDDTGGWELVFRPDPGVWDGQYANNSWLQEMPRPFTKLVWDNAALISPRSAAMLGVSDGNVVRMALDGRTLDAPVLILPGIPEQTLTLTLGYGRTRGGHVAHEDGAARGYNAHAILPSRSGAGGYAATVTVLAGVSVPLVMTRSHHAMENLPGFGPKSEKGALKPDAIEHPGMGEEEIEIRNRQLVRSGTLDDFRKDEDWVARLGGEIALRERGISPEFPGRKIHLTLYPTGAEGGWDYSKGYQWAMSVDASACIGCNACVIACQAENNIPTVGKDQCSRQREMHWIRIDDWFGAQPVGSSADPLADPEIVHMPVMCQHCENAPCEVVCPVGATTHSAEGINEMTYNRCIGTRYCSNNCPYKVRRFNFLLYSDFSKSPRALQYNPDVTVRSRGVMEKCNYCVQRLNRTRMEIEKMTLRLEERARAVEADSPEKSGALRQQMILEKQQMLDQLQTACQQACPTEAIVFGDKNDPQSPVTKIRQDKLSYTLLDDLTTQPRTSYVARLRNPNPKMI